MSDDKARALVLADRLERGQATWGTCDEAAAELRRLAEIERLTAAARVPLTPAQQHADELVEALREISDDYADRFDLDSPSTNPGIKLTIKQARTVLAKIKATGQEGGAA